MAEQVIRVSAKGEFGQLRTGLKNLHSDLRNVTGEIDRSARKGGFFDTSQIRALDLYRRRFRETMGDMGNELQRQITLVDRLERKTLESQRREQEGLRKSIEEKTKELELTQRMVQEQQRLQQSNRQGGRASEAGRSSGGALLGSLGAGGLGRTVLGLAGLSGIVSMATQAYNLAYSKEVDTLDLAQRIRGGAGRSRGSNINLYDEAAAVGMRDRMGYTGQDSWQFLDAYSRIAGNMSTQDQFRTMRFGRAYGLNANEVASLAGQNVAMAGSGSASEWADAIAGSVEQSGMTPRIMEVMETNNALLERLHTSFERFGAKQILAYQTTLDRIGMEKGMPGLTGQRGADVIGGLGGIFGSDPGNQWKWMGIQALQRYNPEKYGNMGLFDLEMQFEDGLMNPDNIPAMSQYIKGATGGNQQLSKRILQKWLMDGGFVNSKREASELWDATGGLEVFSEQQMANLRNGAIDSGAKYAEREGSPGQSYLDTEARYQKALEQTGRPIVEAIQWMKEGVTQGLEVVAGLLQQDDWGGKIYNFMRENMVGLALGAGVAVVAANILKVVSAIGLLSTLFGGSGGSGGGVPGKGGKGGFGGKLLKGAAALGVTASIMAMADGLMNAQGHAESASRAGLDPSELSILDKTAVGLYDGTDSLVSMFTGKDYLTRDGGYRGLASVDPRNPESYWQRAASQTTITDEQRARHQSYQKAYRENPWATNPASALADSLGNIVRWLPEKIFGKSKEEIKTFTSEGEQNIEDFRTDASRNLQGMEIATKTAMGIVQKEHSGLRDSFKPVTDFFTNYATNKVKPGSGMGFGSWSGQYADIINEAATAYGVDPNLIAAVIQQESGFNASAVSHAGAQGLMQLMPGTAQGLGVTDPFDPRQNIMGGTKHLSRLLNHYGNVQTALYAYNAGEGNVNRWMRDGVMDHIPYEETRNYAPSVLARYKQLGGGDSMGDMPVSRESFLALMNETAGTGVKPAVAVSRIEVEFKVSGDGANALNLATKAQLEAMVKKIVADNERMRLQLNPTKAGYSS